MSGQILAAFLLMQTAPAAPGTEVRALTVTMLDAKGDAVTDLAPADVSVSENGVVRDITSFKPDTRPLSVAVLVDSSAALAASYQLNVVEAVTQLVARLPEGARYALWTTGDRPAKVLDFTDDKGAAGKALRRVAPTGGNTMLDAVPEAAADLDKVAREGDRRVVVAITSTGPELSSRDKYRSVEEAKDDADLFLSAQIDEGESDFETRTNLSYVLDRLALATAGRYEVVLSPMGIDRALRKLSAAIRGGYRLSYATTPDLKKRKLELKVARPGTKVLLPAASSTPES